MGVLSGEAILDAALAEELAVGFPVPLVAAPEAVELS
jgi:hypothetical protein